jgi:hypothetical protein
MEIGYSEPTLAPVKKGETPVEENVFCYNNLTGWQLADGKDRQ